MDCHLRCVLLMLASLFQNAETSATFGSRETKGHITAHHVDEVSGLAISRQHPNVGYVHNDKGDSSRIFAVDLISGANLATYDVYHARNYDWEDIAIGPCVDDCRANTHNCSELFFHENVESKPSRYCLYIADIGDHGGDGAVDIIYMVREPSQLKSGTIGVVDTLQFKWQELDAESLMVSPDGRLFVISKVKGGQAKVAQLPASGWGNNVVTTLDMTQTATLKISTTHNDPQGADISANGKEVLIVCEEAVYYYSVTGGYYLETFRNQVPVKLSSYDPVKSTEAISWMPNSHGFFVIPEGDQPNVYFYPRQDIISLPVVG